MVHPLSLDALAAPSDASIFTIRDITSTIFSRLSLGGSSCFFRALLFARFTCFVFTRLQLKNTCCKFSDEVLSIPHRAPDVQTHLTRPGGAARTICTY